MCVGGGLVNVLEMVLISWMRWGEWVGMVGGIGVWGVMGVVCGEEREGMIYLEGVGMIENVERFGYIVFG